MNLFSNILYLSEAGSDQASSLERAVEIALAHRARPTIVHVIDSLTAFNFASTDLRRIQHQRDQGRSGRDADTSERLDS